MGRPETVARPFIHAIRGQGLDAALALVDDQIEYDNVPMAKVFGPEAVRTVLTRSWPDAPPWTGWCTSRWSRSTGRAPAP